MKTVWRQVGNTVSILEGMISQRTPEKKKYAWLVGKFFLQFLKSQMQIAHRHLPSIHLYQDKSKNFPDSLTQEIIPKLNK